MGCLQPGCPGWGQRRAAQVGGLGMGPMVRSLAFPCPELVFSIFPSLSGNSFGKVSAASWDVLSASTLFSPHGNTGMWAGSPGFAGSQAGESFSPTVDLSAQLQQHFVTGGPTVVTQRQLSCSHTSLKPPEAAPCKTPSGLLALGWKSPPSRCAPAHPSAEHAL